MPRTGGGGLRAALTYWGPPVLLGLAIGGAIVLLARMGIFESKVSRLASTWEWGDGEENAKLADGIRELGPSATDDLRDAFLAATCEEPDYKAWLGELLVTEPYNDAQFMADTARSGTACDRRVAAVVLAALLGEDADHELVMPAILDWLEDRATDYHELPLDAVVDLMPLYGEWQTRARAAVIELAKKRPPRGVPPEEDWSGEDRAGACSVLGYMLPDAEIEALFQQIVADDTDQQLPRIECVRGLSRNGSFDTFEVWEQASRSQDSVIRQSIAEHLVRTPDPRFASVLEPLHVDASPMVRHGSLETQMQRREGTALSVIELLLEDSDEWVRFAALEAIAVFNDEPGAERRAGMLLRVFGEGTERNDVAGAVLALRRILKKAPPGFTDEQIDLHMEEVDEAAIDLFVKDAEGRALAVRDVREKLGAVVEWSGEDRIAALEKLREHADPENRARAEKLLSELR